MLERKWADHPEYDRYQFSNDGLIRLRKTGRILKPFHNKIWQCKIIVLVNNDGRRISELVHRLVCWLFNGPPSNPTFVVNHRDGNPLNNEYTNLEWVTQQENINHAIRAGLNKSTHAIAVHDMFTGDEYVFHSIAKAADFFRIRQSEMESTLLRDEAYRGRYVLTIARAPKVTYNAKAVYVLDLTEHRLTCYNSLAEASRKEKVNQGSLRNALIEKRLIVGKLIWLTSDDDWLTYLEDLTDDDIRRSLREHTDRSARWECTYSVMNHRTGDVQVFDRTTEVAKFLNITTKQLDTWLRNKPGSLLYGYSVTRSNRNEEHPTPTADEIGFSLLGPERMKQPMKTTNLETGEVVYWKSVVKFAESLNQPTHVVRFAAASNKVPGYDVKFF